jgi:4-hydroxy-4-methyl-2-oxoglutarate aldolase
VPQRTRRARGGANGSVSATWPAALGLPVFSGSVSIKGTVKETLGRINHTLIIGDEIVHPGDLIKGDADGVVVVRQDEAEDVIGRSRQRVATEEELNRLYHDGKTTIELCNLTDVLKNKGLIVED